MTLPQSRILLLLCSALLLAVGGVGGWYFTLHPYESTDNTYLKSYMSQISPREAGYLSQVLFEDNQRVQAGDLLAVIDDADFKARVAEVEARILVEQAGIESLETDKRTQGNRITAQAATVQSAEAELERTADDRRRFGNLVGEGAVSSQTRDAADAAWKQAKAQRERSLAARREAESQLAGLNARVGEARARIRALQADLELARNALSHTRIVAPMAGLIGHRSAQVGQLVKPGSVLAYLIPAEGLYVEANFKETQIDGMKPGQRAIIRVDAFPKTPFEGVVESFAPASGSEFSLLPPENATGNFTRIVRRVPVKIRFRPGTDVSLLRPGLSATARVQVR